MVYRVTVKKSSASLAAAFTELAVSPTLLCRIGTKTASSLLRRLQRHLVRAGPFTGETLRCKLKSHNPAGRNGRECIVYRIQAGQGVFKVSVLRKAVPEIEWQALVQQYLHPI